MEMVSLEASSTSKVDSGGDKTSHIHLWEWLKRQIDFSKYVPQPQEGVISRELEGKKGTYYILKSPTREYIKMTPADFFLWSQMDGTKTIGDIITAYFLKFKTFAFGRLSMLVVSLRQKGFLSDPPTHLYGQVTWQLQKDRISAWGNRLVQSFIQREFAIDGLDGIISRLYGGGVRLLFLRPLIWLYWLIAGVGLSLFVLLAVRGDYSLVAVNDSIGLGILVLYAGMLITILLHESAHAFTVKRYGHEVRRGGVMLYLGSLAFFVDTMDIWLADKKARIAVSWAGPFMNLIVGGALSVAIFFLPDLALNDLLFKIAAVAYVGALFNMNPLVELDGYFILMDWLEIPSLRRRSLSFLREKLVGKIKAREPFSAEERIFLVFGLLAALYTTFFLVMAAFFLQQRVTAIVKDLWNKPEPWAKLLVGAILLIVVAPFIYSLLMRLLVVLKRAVSYMVARGTFASKGNIALLLLLPAVLLHIPKVVGQGQWMADLGRPALLLAGMGALFLVLSGHDRSYLQRAILTLAIPLFIFLGAECISILARRGAEHLFSAVVLSRAAGLVVFTATAYFSFNVDNLKLASRLEWGLVGLMIPVGAVSGILVSDWLLAGSARPESTLIGAVVSITVINLALMIPLMGGFWQSQLRYAWLYILLAMVTLGVIVVWSALAPTSSGGLFSLVLSLGYSFLSGSVVLYHITEIQTHTQPRPIEPKVGLDAHSQLSSATQHLLESLLAQYQVLFGERQLQALQDTINATCVAARWGVAIDQGRLVTLDNLQDVDVLSLALTYQQLLNQAVSLVEQGGGRRFTKQAMQRAYDRLPWESRELLDEYVLQSTTWGGWLSQQFKELQRDYAVLLSRIPIFFHCTPKELDAICASLKERTYPAGKEIIRQGDMGDAFYIVKDGKVAVWQKDDQGWNQLVNEHNRGGTFGELALLHNAPRNATCMAVTPTTVLVLGREDFQLVRHHFEIKEKVGQNIRYTQILRDIPLFAEISSERLKEVAAYLEVESLRAGDAFVRQGEMGDKFYIIEDGEIEIFLVDADGREKTLVRRGRGEYIGEIALLLNVPRTANARAITSATVLTLTRDEFLKLMRKDLELYQNLERVSSRRMRRLRDSSSFEAEPIPSPA